MDARTFHPSMLWTGLRPGMRCSLVRTALTGLAFFLCYAMLIAGSMQAQDTGDDDPPPVPQTFDWYEQYEIPSQTDWGTPINREATEQIRSWTTREEFISPLVDYLPEEQGITSPTEHFGYAIGKPGELHRVEEHYAYYERLAQDSDRVNFLTLGQSEEGNDFKLLQIGSRENLDRLEEIKQGLNDLADPRYTSEQEARELIDELPLIYTMYSGLHSAETAHPEMSVELAYRLALAEHPKIQQTLENVVIFIVPVVEPDGRNRMVDWYRRHGEGVYDDGADGITRPPYWGQYVGHDNNRNALQLYLRLTEEMLDLFLEWKHPISLDVHEAGSVVYHYFSTGTGPYNEYIDPLTIKEWQWMANYESQALERDGMPGVYTHDFYDGWFPGYLFWITNNRNAIGRFTETWGGMAGMPNTRERTAPGHQLTREWFRPNPGYRENYWSFRNMINFMQAGMIESFYWASKNRDQVLEQFWTKSNNSLNRGREEAPFAYVVPADQQRKADASYMLNLILDHGIEVHRARESGRFGDVQVTAGDYVIRMDQPYRDFAHMLMDVQHYPEEGEQVAYIRGGMAWTFPLMHNVQAYEVGEPGVQELAMNRVDEVHPAGQAAYSGSPDWYAVNPQASAKSIKAAYELQGSDMRVAVDPVSAGGVELDEGSWLIASEEIGAGEMDEWADRFGLTVHGLDEPALQGVDHRPVNLPRIALLHTWRETRDSGAVRYALDYLDIPYTMVSETELGDRDLREAFDVVLFPEQGRNTGGQQIFEGIDERHGPLPYTQTEQFPNHGIPNAADDITGGMGYEGLQALRNFTEGGGTLITLGSATTLPIDYSLTRQVRLFEPDDLIIPGSIVKGEVQDPSNPLTFGYGEQIPLWHKFGPYIRQAPAREAEVPVRYTSGEEDLFMSGVVVEPAELTGQPALMNHGLGDGHMVLFGFNPMHRYQPHGNFALVWNAIMYWDSL